MKLVFLVALLSLSSAFAHFIPESDIRADLKTNLAPQITEQEFNSTIKLINDSYADVVRQHGGKLSLKRKWKNDKIVARATQMFGSWIVEFSGGLARRPELSIDGMSLIICHEIGHHLSGFPFVSGSPFGGYWASVEGQSDYFSTQACARKLWREAKEKNATYRELVSVFAKEKCETVYSTTEDQDLCFRTAVASHSVISTMAALLKKPVPDLSTPDQTVRSGTIEGHPAIQCRYDTLFQGALCSKEVDERIIPGKKTPAGRDSLDAEREAALNSCSKMENYVNGLRPACWFKARL